MERILNNGIKVICVEAPLQTVSISVGIGYGSVDESPRINGSAHFLEHMLFKGTKKRTWEDLNKEISGMGAYSNAETSRESTTYMIKSYKGLFGKSLSIISDMVLNSTIPEKEFELERGPIINENLMYEDNPMFLSWDYMPRLLFKGHPAGMPVGGDNEKTIKKITRDELWSIYRHEYAPSNMIVSVYGGISAKRAHSEIKNAFGGLEMKFRKHKRAIASASQKRSNMLVERPSIKQARIGIGFRCGRFRPDDMKEQASMMVGAELLRYRMFEEVREKRGLSYDPNVSYSPSASFGFINSEAGVEPKNLPKAKEVMLEQFSRMAKGAFTKEEIDRTKRGLIVRMKVAEEDSLLMSGQISRGLPEGG